MRLRPSALRALLASIAFAAVAACGGETTETPKKDAGTPIEEDAAVAATPLRIMNWNVENFYNDKIDSPDGLDEAKYTPTTAAYQAKLTALAQVIRDASADIVVLQEVENEATLKDLAAQPELAGKYPHLFLKPGNDPRGIDIGLLSVRPFSSVVTHAADKFDGKTGKNYRYARDCVEAHLDVEGKEVVLLGVHLRSQIASGGLDEDDKRYAEAAHTRAIADQLLAKNSELPLMVLGDFNDFPNSATIDAIQKGTPAFTDVMTDMPSGEAWTVNYGTPRIYDDQWSSPAFSAARDSSSYSVPRGKTVSDHAPVIATYRLPR